MFFFDNLKRSKEISELTSFWCTSFWCSMRFSPLVRLIFLSIDWHHWFWLLLTKKVTFSLNCIFNECCYIAQLHGDEVINSICNRKWRWMTNTTRISGCNASCEHFGAFVLLINLNLDSTFSNVSRGENSKWTQIPGHSIVGGGITVEMLPVLQSYHLSHISSFKNHSHCSVGWLMMERRDTSDNVLSKSL